MVIISLSIVENARYASSVFSGSRSCQLIILKVFNNFDFAVSFICLDLILFGLFLFEHESQPTHMITGRWSEMSTVRIAECICGWHLVDT